MSDPAQGQESPHESLVSAPDPAQAPPLEDELICVCGQPEGIHRTDGTCDASGCDWFVAFDDAEESTRPDIVVEYEPGCAPRAVR